jgi:hypothetical protein
MSLSPLPFRRALEEKWHERVQEAYRRYQSASEVFRQVVEEQRRELIASSDGTQAVLNALGIENNARKDYMRALHVFTELTLNGRMPEEE